MRKLCSAELNAHVEEFSSVRFSHSKNGVPLVMCQTVWVLTGTRPKHFCLYVAPAIGNLVEEIRARIHQRNWQPQLPRNDTDFKQATGFHTEETYV
jgi:hypothetical protein